MATPCPSCNEQMLSPTMLEQGLPATACPECGGTLLSLVTWRGWRDQNAPGPAPGTEPPTFVADNRTALRCPKCERLMTKYRFAADASNHLDYCLHCEEVWLDRGEWALMEQFALSTVLPKIFTQPWQNRVRSDEARRRQEQRWREVLGEDYHRALDMRTWLTGHPKGKELLAYLYLSQTQRVTS